MINTGKITKEFDTILAALTPSQYRPYYQKWKGKIPFIDIADIMEYQDRYISAYVRKNLPKEIDRRLRLAFDDEINKDENELLYDAVVDQIMENYNFYYEKAVRDNWDLRIEKPITEYKKSDPDLVDAIIIFILENCYFRHIPAFQEFVSDHKHELTKFVEREMEDDAMEYFERSIIPRLQGIGKVKRDISHLYDSLFGRKYRIELDIEITAEDIADAPENEKSVNSIYHSFEDVADNIRAVICEYYRLLGKENEVADVSRSLSMNLFKAKTNYSLGLYENLAGNKRRIGAMFKTIKEKNPGWSYGNMSVEDIEKMFNNRQKPFKGKIIISRHPYDIIGMSTDRGWTSCMNLKTGEYKHFVESSLMNGVLIAYLSNPKDTIPFTKIPGESKEDTQERKTRFDAALKRRTIKGKSNLNINHPSSRLLIKPYIRDGEELDIANPNFILVTSEQYGVIYKKFADIVQKWFNENWNSKITRQGTTETYNFSESMYMEPNDEPYIISDLL